MSIEWKQRIEPEAAVDGTFSRKTAGDVAAISIAISLKRIADALDGGDLAKRLEESLGAVLNENHLWSLGQAFGNGSRP